MDAEQTVRADATNSLLLIVDIQKEQDRWIRGEDQKTINPDHERKREIVPIVRDLAERARNAGVHVVYTQSIRNGTEPEFTVFGRIPILQVGTWHSEMAEELTPQPKDLVVRKWGPDPWYQTDFERVLRGLFPDPTKCNVIVTGGSVTGCAYFGIMGLYARNYRMTILTDCVYGPIQQAVNHFSRTTYPTYPNIKLSRSDLIAFSAAPERSQEKAVPPMTSKAKA